MDSRFERANVLPLCYMYTIVFSFPILSLGLPKTLNRYFWWIETYARLAEKKFETAIEVVVKRG